MRKARIREGEHSQCIVGPATSVGPEAPVPADSGYHLSHTQLELP